MIKKSGIRNFLRLWVVNRKGPADINIAMLALTGPINAMSDLNDRNHRDDPNDQNLYLKIPSDYQRC
jgi:hypothetical protein